MTTDINARLASFVATAYERAPGVRRWFEAAGLTPADIQGVNDLDKVPVLTKDRMVELQAADPPFGGFLTVPVTDVSHLFSSPGPLYEPHADEGTLLETAAPLFRLAGFGPDSVVLNALSYHLVPAGLMVDTVLRQVGATVIPVGVGNADLQVKMMVDFAVTGYVGTASWLMTLLKKAEEEINVPRGAIPLRHALVTAEPLAASVRATLVNAYGLTVTNAYATAELGFLAYDQQGEMAMRLLEGPIIQVVDRDTGKRVAAGDVGEVVVTTFNPTYPLIRFGTGDLAVNVDPAPGRSSQGERAIILVGRVGDAVKVRGMFVHPNQITFALSRFPVAGYQAIVRRPELRDELTLRLVLSDPTTDREALVASLRPTFKQVCRVNVDRVEFVETIPPDAPKIVDERRWD